ncbi:MAG: sulfite exporter TauE/SafE family protein, partial [candidate division Zixibacteria bacterium]|nr:sulfite exporter TauE/SafE family protein [candidate division Zixibacteria bacterium]
MPFPISGIEIQWWLPPLIAFVVAGLSSMAGVSGAFLLLPIQVSLLGITGPVVSSTNMLYNIVAIPSGVYRYVREQRVVWSLVWAIIPGILPGIVLGVIIRVKLMPDPATFKPFAGLVLLYIAGRLVANILRKKRADE